jgi:PAS domain S-box-containing protein
MQLSQLLDMSLVQRLAEANYNANRMPMGIVDALDGSILVRCGWQDICTRFHRVHPESLARCQESDRTIEARLFQTARCEYQCRNGLRDIGIPIVVGSEHLATMFLGQFFYEGETPDRAFFVRQAREFGYDEQAYLAALDRVPVFSRDLVDNVLAYDTALSRFIADLAEGARQRLAHSDERRRAMEQVAAEKEKLAVTLASIGDAVVATDEAGRVTILNQVAEQLTGWRTAEAVGRPLQEIFHIVDERTRAKTASPVERVLRDGCAVGLPNHTALIARDGTERPIADSAAPIRESDGRVSGVVLVFRDQTEERRTAEELRRAHEQAASLARFPRENPDPVLRLARDGAVVYANEAARSALGALETGRPAPPDLLEPTREAAAQGRRVRAEVRSGVRVFAMAFCPVGEEVNAYGNDITERKRAEEALRSGEEQLRVAALAADIGVWTWVPSTGELTVSANWRRLFGVAPDARVTLDTWRDALHPDDRDRALQELHEASDEKREFNTEYRVIRPDGAVRWVVDRGRASYDGDGRPVSMAGVNVDITERKRAEDALRDADRRKNEFLGMLSHELRNPLAPIRNSIYVLDHADPRSEKARRARSVIRRQSEHLARLVDDLLDVTRIARGKIELRRQPLDLSEVVRRTADDHRLVIAERGVKLRVDLPEGGAWVEGDPTRLAQVIGNLLQNAAKFTPPDGEVAVAVSSAPDAVTMTVRDTGIGIEEEMLARIFDPFVQNERTLARSDGGLGLGLSLVKGITDLHGGEVSARSDGRGRGAEFTVRLPPAGPYARPSLERPAGEPPRRARRVLVVDDNVDAADSLADVVDMLGHTVEIACDGPTAIAKARATRPDVVLCDIGLPGMTGHDLARILRAESGGGLQLIAVSGYARPEDKQRAAESGFDGHLAKPPDLKELERLLR